MLTVRLTLFKHMTISINCAVLVLLIGLLCLNIDNSAASRFLAEPMIEQTLSNVAYDHPSIVTSSTNAALFIHAVQLYVEFFVILLLGAMGCLCKRYHVYAHLKHPPWYLKLGLRAVHRVGIWRDSNVLEKQTKHGLRSF